MDHYLSSTPNHLHWGLWDAGQDPAITIASGDRVIIETLSAEPAEITDSPSSFSATSGANDLVGACEPHPRLLTGPIHIESSEPGDVLEVRVLDIRLRADWGWNMQKPTSNGAQGDPLDFCRQHVLLDRARNIARLPWGRELKLSPCFGDICVAPPASWDRRQSKEHGIFGGREDFGVGTTAYFPIFVKGALFSAGYGHALLNDSDDLSLTAVETALTGTFEFHVHRNRGLASPRIGTGRTSLAGQHTSNRRH